MLVISQMFLQHSFIHSFINESGLYTTILLDILHFYTLYITLLYIVNFCLYQ
jgi:hypothetical protein